MLTLTLLFQMPMDEIWRDFMPGLGNHLLGVRHFFLAYLSATETLTEWVPFQWFDAASQQVEDTFQ